MAIAEYLLDASSARSRDASSSQELEGGLSLATGMTGEALFLAAMSQQSPDHRRAALQRLSPLGILASPERTSRPGRDLVATLRSMPLGGQSGLGSMVWSLVWIARLTDMLEPLAYAEHVAELIDEETIRSDRLLDLDGGVAGAALGLLALAEATGKDRYLDQAAVCAEHLLSHQEAVGSIGAAWKNASGLYQTGWSHGAGGILRSLTAVATGCGRTDLLPAALAANPL